VTREDLKTGGDQDLLVWKKGIVLAIEFMALSLMRLMLSSSYWNCEKCLTRYEESFGASQDEIWRKVSYGSSRVTHHSSLL
jgi:hypothetical protein